MKKILLKCHYQNKLETDFKNKKFGTFEIEKSKKIVIVGNGPSVMNNKFGELIDSFDIVVRINHYKPNEYVGYKMDYFVFAPSNIKFFNQEIYDKCKNLLNWDVHNLPSFYDDKEKTINIDSRKINDFFHKNFGFQTPPRRPIVSTGIAAIMIFLNKNPSDKVYIYGFDGLKYHEKVHYFEDKIQTGDIHSSRLEVNFVETMIQKGKIARLENMK
jgi:hypothetical protein